MLPRLLLKTYMEKPLILDAFYWDTPSNVQMNAHELNYQPQA